MSSKEYSDVFEFEILHESEGLRIDKYLNLQLDEASRSYIQKLIKDGDVLLNGRTVKSNYKVRPGDMATVCIPMPSVLDVLPEDIPLEIIYEDEMCIRDSFGYESSNPGEVFRDVLANYFNLKTDKPSDGGARKAALPEATVAGD